MTGFPPGTGGVQPVDPDLDQRVFAPVRRGRWPRIRLRLVAAVALGGVIGGALRYVVGLWLPASSGSFPWAVVTVNTAGAFVLALLLVLVLEVFPPTTYLRPLLGTGFCGALTTFSSVTTGVDQLVAVGRPALAAGYVVLSLATGLVAAAAGIALGRVAARAGTRGR